MKKISALLILLLVLVTITNALATSASTSTNFWYKDGKWWVKDKDGKLHPTVSDKLVWKTELVNYSIPDSWMTDESVQCTKYNGTPVCCLGLTPTAGGNVRSAPSKAGDPSYDEKGNQDYTDSTIIEKLHGSVTVYIHFSFISALGDEWYYVTYEAGKTGLIKASRLAVIVID